MQISPFTALTDMSLYSIGFTHMYTYRFYKKATGATDKERDVNAKQALRAYCSQVINGVRVKITITTTTTTTTTTTKPTTIIFRIHMKKN